MFRMCSSYVAWRCLLLTCILSTHLSNSFEISRIGLKEQQHQDSMEIKLDLKGNNYQINGARNKRQILGASRVRICGDHLIHLLNLVCRHRQAFLAQNSDNQVPLEEALETRNSIRLKRRKRSSENKGWSAVRNGKSNLVSEIQELGLSTVCCDFGCNFMEMATAC